ncbi:MAG: hypothetical protein ACLQBD_29360 [Syntrophobacteraceae bacterium]
MKRLIKFFRSRNTKATSIDMRIVNGLTEQVDEATKKIFDSNATDLLNEPFTNVIAAVCGVSTGKSRPTSTERQIDHTIRPLMRNIQDALETEKLSGTKDCLIDRLIKRLAILQIAFMIQRHKLSLLSGSQFKSIDTNNLADIKVAGHA